MYDFKNIVGVLDQLAKHKSFDDWKPLNGYFANSEDPDEMPHKVAFHKGLHCLLRQNIDLQRKKYNIFGIITCYPSIYRMDHHDLTLSIYMENSIGLKRVKIKKTMTRKG